MRNFVFILSVFAALVCFEKPLRRKTMRGVPITISGREEPRIVGSQHLNNVWPL
jgi:hypothetical protein